MKNIFFLQNKYYEILIFMCFIIQKGIFKVYSSIHRHAQTQTDTDTHTETHTHTHTHRHTHTHTHTHTHHYICIHIHLHIYIHTHTHPFSRFSALNTPLWRSVSIFAISKEKKEKNIQCFQHAFVEERQQFR